MKSSTKRFTGSVATLATLASVVAPVVANAETMTVAKAKELVAYAKETKVFAEYNIAYAAILQLPEKDQAPLLAELAPLYKEVVTADVQAVLDILKTVATEKGLDSYYAADAKIQKEVTNVRNQQYLSGELAGWGRQGVFTADVVAATDAINKAWANPTTETVAAAKEAASKVTNAKSLAWLNTEIKSVEAKVTLTVKSIEGAGAKKVKVTFNKPVEDTTKLNLTVKRDGVTVTIASTEWNADKTVATLTASANLISGKYVVTSTFDTAAATTTAATQIDAAKINKIVFASENAVITGATSAQAKIKALNQYGEDATSLLSSVSVSSSKGTWDSSSVTGGVVNLTGASFAVGDKLVVTVVDGATATVGTATLTVAQAAAISSLTIGDLAYDDTSITSTDVNVSSDLSKFYLPITAKDQYGNTLTAAQIQASLTAVLSSDSTIVGVTAASIKNNAAGKPVIFLTDGSNSGTAVITLVAGSGVSANKTITVNANGKVDTLTITDPSDILKQGVAITLPFTAADQYGNALTTASQFGLSSQDTTGATSVTLGGATVSVTGGTLVRTIDYNNGNKVGLKLTPGSSSTSVVLTVISETGKVQTLTYAVNAAPKATNISGIDASNFNVLLQQGVTSANLYANLKYVDQYGVAIDQSKVARATGSGINVTVSAIDSNSNIAVNTTNAGTSTEEITFTANTTNAGVRAYKVQLRSGSTVIDEYVLNMESVALKSIESYGVNTLSKQYTGNVTDSSVWAQDVTVYGMKSGKKVTVDSATLIKNVSATNNIAVTGRTIMPQGSTAVDTDGVDKTAKVTVLVDGYNGLVTLTQDLTYNSATPRIASIATYKSDDSTALSGGVIVVTSGAIVNNASVVKGVGTAAPLRFKYVDQYGKDFTKTTQAAVDVKYVVTGVTSNGVVDSTQMLINADGTLNKVGTFNKNNDTFTITAITTNGLTTSVKVIIGN